MIHGCRPTSAVNQPVRIAIHGSGKPRKIAPQHPTLFGNVFPDAEVRAVPGEEQHQQAAADHDPERKERDRTGGRSCTGKSASPTSFEVKLMLPMRLPRMGTLIA